MKTIQQVKSFMGIRDENGHYHSSDDLANKWIQVNCEVLSGINISHKIVSKEPVFIVKYYIGMENIDKLIPIKQIIE